MLKNCFLLNWERCCFGAIAVGGKWNGRCWTLPSPHTLITLRLCHKNKRIATFSRKNMHEKCTAPHWILHKNAVLLHEYTTMVVVRTTTTTMPTTENLTIHKIFAAALKVVGVFSKRLPPLHRLTSANLKFINTKRMENEMHGDPAAENHGVVAQCWKIYRLTNEAEARSLDTMVWYGSWCVRVPLAIK